jgi:hypothetical protein
LVVELTDALQGGFDFAIVAQPLFDDGFLFGTEADLLGAAAGIGDGQHGDEMALAAGADGAAEAMADAALEQGAAEDVGGGGEGRGELGEGSEGLVRAFNLYI